jgi:hypothetical protein
MSFATSARGGESGAGPLEAGGAAAAKTSRGMARKRAGDGEVERASGRGVGSTRGRCAVANSDATRPRRSPETLVSGKTIPRRNHERPLVQSGAREFPRRFQSPWQPGDRLTSGVREKDLEDLNRVCGKKICLLRKYYRSTARTVPRLCAVAAAWRVAGGGWRSGTGVTVYAERGPARARPRSFPRCW